MSISEINEANKVDTKKTYFKYTKIPELNSVILRIDSFGTNRNFEAFIIESFKSIKTNNIKNIIIDIRNNPGGSSSLSEMLLSITSDKDISQFERKLVKYSKTE